MELNLRKERISTAYVAALCATTGCSIGTWDVDNDSVDLSLKMVGATGVIPSPMLDVQLKATARATVTAEGLRFPLKTKNFEDLRAPSHYPRILVVLALPGDDPRHWLEESDETRLALMSCAYWACLQHMDDLPENATSATVPLRRRLTAEQLLELMQRVSHQEPLIGGNG
jgi:hypothetical protein